jgi:hypothetical protein
MYELTRDFNECAKLYGKIIISERHLPVHLKSVRPAKLGGIAGGQKFVVANIVFKFAQDVLLPGGEYLYGGSEPDEEAAHKAAGHERKGINCIIQRALEGVAVPLMTLVDFRGFRLSAQSLVPIGPGSLVYGSEDAGRTILSGEGSRHLPTIRALSVALHLCEHRVQDGTGREHALHLPVDIEVHQSKRDPRTIFCIDTARLMPPMRAARDRKRDIYSKLFRQEFLARYPVRLSSDALSGFGVLDRERHNEAVREATRVMMEKTIPATAALMRSADAVHATRFLQQRGVNARFLGQVRLHARDEAVRAALLVEMIARVSQKVLRAGWRHEKVEGLSTLPSLQLAVSLLNELRTQAVEPPWLRSRLLLKYGDTALQPNEPLPAHKAVERLCELAGLQVAHSALQQTQEPLSLSDVEMDARVKVCLAMHPRCFARRPAGMPCYAPSVFCTATSCNTAIYALLCTLGVLHGDQLQYCNRPLSGLTVAQELMVSAVAQADALTTEALAKTKVSDCLESVVMGGWSLVVGGWWCSLWMLERSWWWCICECEDVVVEKWKLDIVRSYLFLYPHSPSSPTHSMQKGQRAVAAAAGESLADS